MYEFATFYLMTSIIQLLPAIVITLCLLHGITFPIISYLLGHRTPVNPGPQNIGFARFKHFLRFFKATTMNYMTRFYMLACCTKLTTTVLTVLGTLLDLMFFSLSTSALQLTPVVIIVLTLLYGKRLPCLPPPLKNRAPFTNEIIRAEQQSQDFASIRLTRFEKIERTSIYATCRNDRLGTVFKVVFCQEKEAGARTRSYVYTHDDPTLQEIIPPPVGVNELEEILDSEKN